MPSANEDLRSAAVRHSVYISRFRAGAVARQIALLQAADADIVERILKRVGSSGTFTDDRLAKLLDDIRTITADIHTKFRAAVRGELKDLAGYEAGFQADTMTTAIGFDPGIVQPSGGLVYAAAMSRPMQGRLLRDWFSGLEVGQRQAVEQQLRIGIVEGETIQQMVQRIRGTKAAAYKDGILEINRRNATAVVRTAVNHVVNTARDATYEANQDIIKGWQFVATLDARTTVICQALDGKVFSVGSGPQPPRHFNCRSTTAPVLKSWRELGVPIDEVPDSTRASMNGQVPQRMTYEAWLKTQPASVQRDVLGASRYKMWKTGDITLDRFVDRKGHKYTLAELAKREAAVFEEAGLG